VVRHPQPAVSSAVAVSLSLLLPVGRVKVEIHLHGSICRATGAAV
jgi:hypothetical protein